MNKHLSQEKRDTLASEFTYQGKKSGMIGGYCEADFPLYYANEEMAELLGYGSVEELAAGIGGRVANTRLSCSDSGAGDRSDTSDRHFCFRRYLFGSDHLEPG